MMGFIGQRLKKSLGILIDEMAPVAAYAMSVNKLYAASVYSPA